MSNTDFSEKILGNMTPQPLGAGVSSDPDLDRMCAVHNRHTTLLTNIYEICTHKTVLLCIAALLVVALLVSRYVLVGNPLNKYAKAVNEDSGKAFSYFATAVASWFVTKNLENKR